MRSLRRTLAVRFSLTMLVALVLIALWAVMAGRAVLREDLLATGIGPASTATAVTRATRDLLALMTVIVVLASVTTMFGAGWLARSATHPVSEIAHQAAAIAPGVTGQRITAHAGVTEFAALVRVLNAMLERLDRGVEAHRRLLADAGHDLRTPITAMRGTLEVALRGTRTPEQYRRVLESVLEDVNHLGGMGESLLLLGRLDAGALTPRREPVALARLFADAVQRWRTRLEPRPVRIAVSPEMAVQALDPRLVALALDHLLDNITRHTPPETTVVLQARPEGTGYLLAVDDDGPGQPPDVLAQLFERFWRGDPARARGGAGLGLTLVQAVAQAHGGRAWAEASSAGGLRIGLTLPG